MCVSGIHAVGVPSEAFYGDHGAAEKASIYSFFFFVNSELYLFFLLTEHVV